MTSTSKAMTVSSNGSAVAKVTLVDEDRPDITREPSLSKASNRIYKGQRRFLDGPRRREEPVS